MAILLAAGGRLEVRHLLKVVATLGIGVAHVLGDDDLRRDPTVLTVKVAAEVALGSRAGAAGGTVLLVDPEVAELGEVLVTGAGVAVDDQERTLVAGLGTDELGEVGHHRVERGAAERVAFRLVVQVIAVQTVLLDLVEEHLGGIDAPLRPFGTAFGVAGVRTLARVGLHVGAERGVAGVQGGGLELLGGHLALEDLAHVVILVGLVRLHEGRDLGFHAPAGVLEDAGDAAADHLHTLDFLAGLHFLVVQGALLGAAAPEVDHVHAVRDVREAERHRAVVGEENVGDAAGGDAVRIERGLLPVPEVLVVSLIPDGVHRAGALDELGPGLGLVDAGGALDLQGLHFLHLFAGSEDQGGAHQNIECLFHDHFALRVICGPTIPWCRRCPPSRKRLPWPRSRGGRRLP